jgi:hypothetical protein
MFKKLALAGALALVLFSPCAAQTVFSAVQTCTTSAAPLSAQFQINGVILKADYANTSKVYVGGPGVTTATGYPLAAGEAISYGANLVPGLASIYMICSNTTDILHFTGN